MNMFLSGNTNIVSSLYTNERSTSQMGNIITKPLKICNILRNYIYILDTLPENIGVHVTISAIISPFL